MPFRLRALIVEDNAIILENLQGFLLEMTPVDVVGTARAEQEACLWMDSRTQGCDIAIIDLSLDGGSGLGVLQHIACYALPPDRIMLTNSATPDVRKRCKDLGASEVFDKSTEIDKLIDWLASRAAH